MKKTNISHRQENLDKVRRNRKRDCSQEIFYLQLTLDKFNSVQCESVTFIFFIKAFSDKIIFVIKITFQ